MIPSAGLRTGPARAVLAITTSGRRGVATASVHSRDRALLVLAPADPASLANISPGQVMRPAASLSSSSSSPHAIVLAKAGGKLVAACVGEVPAKGTMLHSTVDVESSVASQPPRDFERQVIMRGWRTRVPSLDAMVPLGLGQSMLFFDPAQTLFDAVCGALNPRIPSAYPGVQDDEDTAAILGVFKACEQAELDRNAGRHAALAIPDMNCFVRFWTRATGTAERGEMRHFYSGLIQRAALLASDKGGGSLTLLARLPRPSSKPRALDANEDLLGLLESEVKEGRRSANDFARLVRVAGRGIRVTREVLDKLSIPPPMPANERIACAHSEELMSIFDGHVVAASSGPLPLDPRASLTRIGAGSNPNDVRDTRSKLLRTAAGPLRLDWCDAMASLEHDPQAAGLVEAVNKVLVHPPLCKSEKGQAALVWAARNGVDWERRFDAALAEKVLDVDKGAAECVFAAGCDQENARD